MGKVKGKHRLDKFYHLAKEQGYRSRAAFKLLQLDSKYNFLHSSRSVLDLCAAPGGWMQVAVQKVPVGSLVLGIDLFPIRPIRGAISVQEDITKPKCRTTVKRILGENGFNSFDLVLHDGSPNVGGAWAQEATSQNALVIDSVRLATEFLAPKGTFVTKVFRSQDYNAVIYCLRALFESVEVTKPSASRQSSAEIFVVGFRYKAPAKVDPRLLDIKHLFQGATEPQKVVDVLRGDKKDKRHRSGYDDGAVLVRKPCSAAKFVESENPVDMLGTITSINFDDPASLPIKNHPLTTEEVLNLCDDLLLLKRPDFKQLLKWRMNVRKALFSTEKSSAPSVDANEDKDVEEQSEDDKLLNELEEETNASERQKKREKKLLAKRRAKDKARKATGMQVDALQDGYVDTELFSLASVKGKQDLAAVDTTEDVEVNELSGSDNDEDNDADDDTDSSDMDSDEERKRYEDELDEILDEAYERYAAKHEGSTKQRKRAKKAYTDAELLEGGGSDGEAEAQPADDSDKEKNDEEANPLIVPISEDRQPTQDEIMQRWFSQDVFAQAVEGGDLGKDDSDDDMDIDVRKPKISAPKKATKALQQQSLAPEIPKKSSNVDDDLEVVPAPATDSSDSSSSDEDSEGYDTDTKCETLAFAKQMLSKRRRDEIIDDAYNKYMFDDEGLPRWFVDDEKRHYQPIKPITKEEVAAIKAQFKEINARPAKKVAEAKARKKRAAMRKLEKIRKKANTIADQSDIPDRSKRRMIEQLYKKAVNPQKPKKEYVVAKKGVQVRAGKGKVLVDRRMKKDARQHGMTKQAKNGKGKGKGKAKGNAKAKGKGSVKMGKGTKGKAGRA